MRKYLFILLFIPLIVFGQDTVSDARYQKVIMSVIQHINEYETSSSFYGETRRDQFKDLFKYPTTKIVNDIPAIGNYDEIISVEEYVSKMQHYYTKIGVDIEISEISNVIFENNNKGTLSVFVTKKVKGGNDQYKIKVKEEGEEYDEWINYKDQFDLEIQLSINNNSVKITAIKLAKPKGKLLVISPHLKVFLKKEEIPIDEISVKIDGIDTYISDYFFSIPDINENTEIKITSNDENLILSSGSGTIDLDKCNKLEIDHLYKLTFKKTIGDVQAFALMPISSKVIENTNTFNATVSDNSTLSYGGVIAFNIDNLIFRSKEKRKYSFYFKGGGLVESFDYDIKIPNYTESYLHIDSDGGNYLRTVLLTDFSENQKIDMKTFFFQLEGRIKRNVNEKLSLLLSLSGGLGWTSVNSATYTNSALGNYSGYYGNLFGVTIAENGVYNFGEFNLSQNGDLGFNNVQTFLLGLDGSIRFNNLVLSGGIVYTKFQSNIFDIGEERVSHESNNFNSSEKNELNTINNLIDVNMDHLSIKVGISYKF